MACLNYCGAAFYYDIDYRTFATWTLAPVLGLCANTLRVEHHQTRQNGQNTQRPFVFCFIALSTDFAGTKTACADGSLRYHFRHIKTPRSTRLARPRVLL